MYLERVFVPGFNKRFTVEPAQPQSAFVPIVGLDLELVLSEQYDRVVDKDNTVAFECLELQLVPTATRAHYARCAVQVHRLLDNTLAVSFQGKVIARFRADGVRVPLAQAPQKKRKAS